MIKSFYDLAQTTKKKQCKSLYVLGEPDVDYPIFATPPDTGFVCGDKADGMYADVDARCQVYKLLPQK